MSYVEKAIREAEKAGYTIKNVWGSSLVDSNIYKILLEPQFWQALGKARGWDKRIGMSFSGYEQDEEGNTDGTIEEAWSLDEWHYRWHLFIDHLASGGTPETFFEGIIGNKEV